VTNSGAGADVNVLSKAFLEYARIGATSVIKNESDFFGAADRIVKATIAFARHRKINGVKSCDCDEFSAAKSSAPSIKRTRSFYRARNVINGQQEVATETPKEVPESPKTLLKQRKVSTKPSERKKLVAKPSKTLKPKLSKEIRETLKPLKTKTVQPVKPLNAPKKRPRDSALAFAHCEDDDFQRASLEELLLKQKVLLQASNAAIKKLKDRV